MTGGDVHRPVAPFGEGVRPAQPAIGQHRLDGRAVQPLDGIVSGRGEVEHACLAHP